MAPDSLLGAKSGQLDDTHSEPGSRDLANQALDTSHPGIEQPQAHLTAILATVPDAMGLRVSP